MTITFDGTLGVGDIISNIILFLTFLALIWYSLETRSLRQWQKKQVQTTLLNLDIQRVMYHAEHPSVRIPYVKPWPIIMREIYELGEFDLKDLYSSSHHQPLTKTGKLLMSTKKFLNSFFKKT